MLYYICNRKDSNEPIWDIQFHPTDETLFLTCGQDIKARLYKINKQTETLELLHIFAFEYHTRTLRRCSWIDSSTIAISSFDNSVSIWNFKASINQTKIIEIINFHEGEVKMAKTHPYLPFLASCGRDRMVWIAQKEQDRYSAKDVLEGHTGDIKSVAWDGDFPLALLSCSYDESIISWYPEYIDGRIEWKREEQIQPEGSGTLWCILSTHNLGGFIVGSNNGNIYYYKYQYSLLSSLSCLKLFPLYVFKDSHKLQNIIKPPKSISSLDSSNDYSTETLIAYILSAACILCNIHLINKESLENIPLNLNDDFIDIIYNLLKNINYQQLAKRINENCKRSFVKSLLKTALICLTSVTIWNLKYNSIIFHWWLNLFIEIYSPDIKIIRSRYTLVQKQYFTLIQTNTFYEKEKSDEQNITNMYIESDLPINESNSRLSSNSYNIDIEIILLSIIITGYSILLHGDISLSLINSIDNFQFILTNNEYSKTISTKYNLKNYTNTIITLLQNETIVYLSKSLDKSKNTLLSNLNTRYPLKFQDSSYSIVNETLMNNELVKHTDTILKPQCINISVKRNMWKYINKESKQTESCISRGSQSLSSKGTRAINIKNRSNSSLCSIYDRREHKKQIKSSCFNENDYNNSKELINLEHNISELTVKLGILRRDDQNNSNMKYVVYNDILEKLHLARAIDVYNQLLIDTKKRFQLDKFNFTQNTKQTNIIKPNMSENNINFGLKQRMKNISTQPTMLVCTDNPLTTSQIESMKSSLQSDPSNTITKEEIFEIPYIEEPSPIYSLSTTKDNSIILSAGAQRCISIHTINKAKELEKLIDVKTKYHQQDINAVSINCNDSYVASVSDDGALVVWRINL